ncbi:MAG: ABC transporter permease subunit [Armatimonadota bacterium]
MDPPEFGFVPLAAGSASMPAGAVAVAVPLGVGTTVFASEAALPAARDLLKPLVELLAAVPSVVMDMVVLEPLAREAFGLPTGLTVPTVSVTLAFTAVPTIAEDALTAVANEYREGRTAVGATRWQTIHRITVPAAVQGGLESGRNSR